MVLWRFSIGDFRSAKFQTGKGAGTYGKITADKGPCP